MGTAHEAWTDQRLNNLCAEAAKEDEFTLKNARAKVSGLLVKAGIVVSREGVGYVSQSSVPSAPDPATSVAAAVPDPNMTALVARQQAAMEALTRRATEASREAARAQENMLRAASSAAQTPSVDPFAGAKGTDRRRQRTEAFYDRVMESKRRKKGDGKSGKGGKGGYNNGSKGGDNGKGRGSWKSGKGGDMKKR